MLGGGVWARRSASERTTPIDRLCAASKGASCGREGGCTCGEAAKLGSQKIVFVYTITYCHEHKLYELIYFGIAVIF